MKILRQKEFGLIGKMADKLGEKVNEDWDEAIDNINKFRRKSLTKSKEEKRLSRKLAKYAKENGIDVINEVKGSQFAIDKRQNPVSDFDDFISDRSSNLQRKLNKEGADRYRKSKQYKEDIKAIKTAMRQRKAVRDGRGYINVHVGKTDVGSIGHEVFHILDRRKFDLKRNYDKAGKIADTEPTSRLDALKKSIQIGYYSIPRLREEAKASRGSIKWLKQNGASKPLIKTQKEGLKNMFKTYKCQYIDRVLLPIAYYKDRSILKDTKDKLSQSVKPVATLSQGKAINKVYGKGGRF